MRQMIIQSFLDTDFYKLTMGQFVFHRYPDVPVRYGFRCRTPNIFLAQHIKQYVLRRELDYARTLRPTDDELLYLAGLTGANDSRLFQDDYLHFLADIKLPDYELTNLDGHYRLEFSGNWAESIYWETLALPIMNQLYYESILDTNTLVSAYQEGWKRLKAKIEVLKQHPEVHFIDFGLRRQFSQLWHENVVRTLKQELSSEQFLGVSHIQAAKRFHLKPSGTMAHELFMVRAAMLSQLDATLKTVHQDVLNDWWDEYGHELAIALTDTFTFGAFLNDFTPEQAANFKGLRHDSGDPIAFADRAIAFYEKLGIDPKSKILVFSDGLDLNTMLRITAHCAGLIAVTFGWGTNLSNDMGLKPLSLVIKAIQATGFDTVKLSDNLAKATGTAQDIERHMRVFGIRSIDKQEVKY